jgi:hypothetical protein
MNIPRYMRAKLTASNGGKVEVAIQEVQQVISFVDGYPSPPQWEVVRTLTEDEVKQLGISFAEEKG